MRAIVPELTIPIPGENMATTVDPTVDKLTDQRYTEQIETFRHAANQSAAGDDKVAELTRNMFAQASYLVGAKAAQLLDTDKMAADILAQRSAMNQPQAAPSFVVPTVVKPA